MREGHEPIREERRTLREAVDAAENAGPVVVDAPVIVEVAADEAGVAEAKPSSLIV